MTDELRQTALEWYRNGYSVVPIRTSGKAPACAMELVRKQSGACATTSPMVQKIILTWRFCAVVTST